MEITLDNEGIVRVIREAHPNVQAIYLFGSFASGDPWPTSDVDIAILLPSDEAEAFNFDAWANLYGALYDVCKREADLIYLRQVNTVFQHIIIFSSEILYCSDEYAKDEFEMITMSMYQRLNEERAEIMEDFLKTGRAYSI